MIEYKHAGTLPDGEYFKVNNKGKDIYHSWTLDLLSPEQQAQFEAYVDAQIAEVTERVRRSGGQSELQALKKMPTAMKLRDWVGAQQIGIDKIQDDFASGKIKFLPINYRPELKFKLPMGVSYLTRAQAQHFVAFRRGTIPQKLKLGESKERVMYEGFIDFDPIEQDEYEAGISGVKKK